MKRIAIIGSERSKLSEGNYSELKASEGITSLFSRASTLFQVFADPKPNAPEVSFGSRFLNAFKRADSNSFKNSLPADLDAVVVMAKNKKELQSELTSLKNPKNISLLVIPETIANLINDIDIKNIIGEKPAITTFDPDNGNTQSLLATINKVVKDPAPSQRAVAEGLQSVTDNHNRNANGQSLRSLYRQFTTALFKAIFERQNENYIATVKGEGNFGPQAQSPASSYLNDINKAFSGRGQQPEFYQWLTSKEGQAWQQELDSAAKQAAKPAEPTVTRARSGGRQAAPPPMQLYPNLDALNDSSAEPANSVGAPESGGNTAVNYEPQLDALPQSGLPAFSPGYTGEEYQVDYQPQFTTLPVTNWQTTSVSGQATGRQQLLASARGEAFESQVEEQTKDSEYKDFLSSELWNRATPNQEVSMPKQSIDSSAGKFSPSAPPFEPNQINTAPSAPAQEASEQPSVTPVAR